MTAFSHLQKEALSASNGWFEDVAVETTLLPGQATAEALPSEGSKSGRLKDLDQDQRGEENEVTLAGAV